jgi:hypothetical protein
MPAFTSFVDQIDFTLQEPRDQIEEGERINAFWAVFLMDRCLAVAFGPPLVISDMDAPGMQIDTPWPLEMETYERVRTPFFVCALSLSFIPCLCSGSDTSKLAYERDRA